MAIVIKPLIIIRLVCKPAFFRIGNFLSEFCNIIWTQLLNIMSTQSILHVKLEIFNKLGRGKVPNTRQSIWLIYYQREQSVLRQCRKKRFWRQFINPIYKPQCLFQEKLTNSSVKKCSMKAIIAHRVITAKQTNRNTTYSLHHTRMLHTSPYNGPYRPPFPEGRYYGALFEQIRFQWST